ncbi:MAG: DUF5711 family protein [Bacteroidales bacterium]|nr:DUF5711 family protein [Bacteroidales bacterium]MCM1414950.1 DUF5711 family protein [bacterium]MCM1424796.1 DUF5711 family protein [bacterium]
MVSVRDYFKRKQQSGDRPPRISYREKIKSHKFTVFYRISLVLILFAAVGAALFLQWKNKVYIESVELSSVEIKIPSDASLMPFGANLLIYSKDGASCMDTKGNAVWNQTFGMQNPMVDINQNVAAIGDYNGREIYVMDTGNLLGRITTNRPVRNFCVSASGVVAAVLDDTDVTWIYLYDAQGNELVYFRTTMKESGYPIHLAISPSGELVCVSYLYVDGGHMKSSVAFYNFGAVGQNSTDNYVSGYDYIDSVVPFSRFLDNKSLFAVSDDRIMFFGGAQKPVTAAENLLSDEVRGIYYGSEYVGLVFNSKESGGRYRLDVYHKSGTFQQSIEYDIDCRDILFHEDQIIIYNEADCRIYNSSGMQKYAGTFSKTALMLIPQKASYNYMIVTPDSIDTIELK